jgi:hypothetical protein
MKYDNPRFIYTTFSGNWTIDGKYKILDMEYITNNMLSEDRIKIIKHKEIAWRNKHHFPYGSGDNCPCCHGKKFRECDPNIPGIIVYNCPNPYDNKYRMLDGRHRIMRLLFEGKTESKFYVFDFNEIKHFIGDPNPKSINILITPR